MVQSVIKPMDITYNEHRKIDQEDIDYTTFVYETSLHDQDIDIVLGNEKHNFSKYDILHFSVYLIIDELPVSRIGIFEIDSNKYLNSIDEDGSIDLDKGELIFFINNNELVGYIANSNIVASDNTKKPDMDIEKDSYVMTDEDFEDITDQEADNAKDTMRVKTELIPSDKKTETSNEDSIFVMNKDIETLPILDEENEKDSDDHKSKYIEGIKTTWVEKFTKNNHFDLIDNEGGGNCLFATMRDAFESIGKKTTVDKLRVLLSKEADEELYNNYRMLYLSFLNEHKSSEQQMKDMQARIKTLKKMIDKTSKKDENDRLLKQLKEQIGHYDIKKNERNDTKELLKEFSYMDELDTFDKFRDFITSSRFWGDTWSISTLEKLLNVKIIVLSEEAYNSEDIDSIMQCGQLNDTDIEDAKIFKPDYYIMVSYTGNHYKLINYKSKGIFRFRELPFDIKSLIVNKCLEKNAGPYYLIQDFRKYKEKIGLDANIGEPTEEDLNSDLYDKNVIFMSHSKSNKKPKAGKGSGETIPDNRLIEFNRLNKISDWRRKLNDDWTAPFTIDGMRWNSVTHYYLGSQYKKGFPDFSKTFSLDSGSKISQDIDVANAAVETGKYKKQLLRSSEITTDPDFFEVGLEPRYKLERERALDAKFTQNNDLKQALMETQHAKLIQFRRGKEPVIDEPLMKLRNKLS